MLRKSNQPVKLLSIIVPAYKQEKTIVTDIKHIQGVLKTLQHQYEILVVVDGHADDTYIKIKGLQSSKVKVLTYDKNQGKGHAVRYGMLHAKGDVIGFLDAGMDLNPAGLKVLLDDFQKYDADIVVGSKRHPLSKVIYPMNRRVISKLSQMFVKVLFGLNVTDTQVGMKFFKRKVIKKVLPRLLVKKFAFDIEMLSVAYYLGFRKIYEAPIELTHNFQTSILSRNILNALFYTLWDTCAVFYRLKIIHYYDRKKKLRYKTSPEYEISIT